MNFKEDNSGLNSAEVRVLQKALKAKGFDPGPVDGIIGPRTEAAIILFKRHKGLKPRPYVGLITWKLIMGSDLMSSPGEEEYPWMREARRVLGYHELEDNTKLRGWLASDGYALGDPSRLPWCGDYVETSIRLGLPREVVPGNPYWALNWKKWGLSVKPTYGCVISIERNGGGHVAFLVGQDDNRYFCLGGNQSNRVSVVPILKTRFELDSFRWPKTWALPDLFTLPRVTSNQPNSTSTTEE